ncbi:MAG: phenylalanine--tRNA ligase subunit beta [Clostridiales bacterium]|jgi:phenylalanyl-tRNA synthetase beta chain|nr:phenylalanine--tRNA ligase subunit beta [Clostridiales bacterium]
MDVPVSWLKSLVNYNADTRRFIEDITLTGTKVESVKTFGADLSGIVTGRILTVEKHGNSDRLLICKVDVGDGVVQIVTGAGNVYAGAVVPIVLNNGTISGGQRIKTGKLRGELSEGMMCSIEELGYSRQEYPESPEDGIYIFSKEDSAKYPPGSDAREALGLLDEAIEFEITSNRPDCYSVLGIAREAAATYNLPFDLPEITVKEEAESDIHSMISVSIENPELCPRYIARVVKDVKIGPSPLWMRRRLIASGLRPINNIVDITNYVMLEYGQPMHAFDIDNIAERRIIVRNARENETFTTLDGAARRLDPSMLVIADPQKAVAIAGVMGGENSKVTEGASAVLFESANFNGTNIRLTSKKLGLRTDASSKYEKGLDPSLAYDAVNRAVSLVEELGCGKVVKGMEDCYPYPYENWTISFYPSRINALLGTDIPPDEMRGYLARVGVRAWRADEGDQYWFAEIPTFRQDIMREADIAEEVARLYGYGRIKSTISSGSPTMGKKTRKQNLEDLLKNLMSAEGFDEAMTYSFESPKVFDKLRINPNDRLRDTVKILNPLGEDYSIMRTSTVNSMLTSLSTNYGRRNKLVRLYEMAKVYWPRGVGEFPEEMDTLTLGAYGEMDFYALKGVIERILDALGVAAEYESVRDLGYLHPGRAAEFIAGEASAGILGEVHPDIAAEYEINERAYYAVLFLKPLFEQAVLARYYKPLPKYPGVQRDIAMKVKDDVPVRAIETAIREEAGAILEAVELFDVYKGSQIEAGYKSVAYSISFRRDDRTLTDEEVSEVMKRIISNLETKAGAQLRDR